MKLTKARLKRFEEEQTSHSTETAIFNLMFEWAAEMLHYAEGVTTPIKQIKITRFKKEKKAR